MKHKFSVSILIGVLVCLAGIVGAQHDIRHQQAVFDFDGDRKSDLVRIEDSNTNLVWHILRSSDGAWQTVTFGLSSMNDVAVPADYNGDGICDVAIWRPGTGTDLYRGQAHFWILASTPKGEPSTMVIPWGLMGDNPRVTQDFDGDGIADPAIVRRENGNMVWWILQSKAGVRASTYGTAEDYFVRGDYDGDGMADLAVYRTVEDKSGFVNGFIVNYSSTNEVVYTPFGLPGDIIIPGDFDGDKSSDYAVFRNNPSKADPTAYWFWQRSRDGVVESMPFGLNMINESLLDCPAPGDYDSDGAADLGVWRMNMAGYVDSEFHMLMKKDGYKAFPFGTMHTEVPNFTMQAVDTKYPQ